MTIRLLKYLNNSKITLNFFMFSNIVGSMFSSTSSDYIQGSLITSAAVNLFLTSLSRIRFKRLMTD